MTTIILGFVFILSITLNLVQERKLERFEKMCKDMK